MPTAPPPDAEGWITWACGAKAGGPHWNAITLPPDWTDVLLYVTDIDWNNGLEDVTTLFMPPDGRAIQVAAQPGVNLFITSDSKAFPMPLSGVSGSLWSATNDSYVDDNSGGYVIKIKKRP